jgi:hypothetical protein
VKQVLYRTLFRIEGVERIDDQVQVTYCNHLRNQFAEMQKLQS